MALQNEPAHNRTLPEWRMQFLALQGHPGTSFPAPCKETPTAYPGQRWNTHAHWQKPEAPISCSEPSTAPSRIPPDRKQNWHNAHRRLPGCRSHRYSRDQPRSCPANCWSADCFPQRDFPSKRLCRMDCRFSHRACPRSAPHLRRQAHCCPGK